MANKAQYDAIIVSINENLKKIKNYNLEQIIREKELGSNFSFKEASTSIMNHINLYKKIDGARLEIFPFATLNNIGGELSNTISLLESMIKFNPQEGNPVAQRNSLIQNLDRQYERCFPIISPTIAYQLLDNNLLNSEQDKVGKIIEELELTKSQFLDKSNSYLKDMEMALKSAQDSAAKSGVAKYSNLFKDESEFHKKEASFWLRWTGWGIAAIVLATVLLIIFFPDETSRTGEIIQYTISKIIILSVLFYGLALFNKNYKAHKHNEVLNKHRQNALATFETFSNAAGSDNQTKSAVLIEATKTIFSNQQTGYLDVAIESESSNKIIEIFKSASSKEG